MKSVNRIASVVLAMAPYFLNAQTYENTFAVNASDLVARNSTGTRRIYDHSEPLEEKSSVGTTPSEDKPLLRIVAKPLDYKIAEVMNLNSGMNYKRTGIDLGFSHLDTGKKSEFEKKYDAMSQVRNMSIFDYNKKKSLLYEQHYPLNRNIELVLEEEIVPRFKEPEFGIYATIKFHLN